MEGMKDKEETRSKGAEEGGFSVWLLVKAKCGRTSRTRRKMKGKGRKEREGAAQPHSVSAD